MPVLLCSQNSEPAAALVKEAVDGDSTLADPPISVPPLLPVCVLSC